MTVLSFVLTVLSLLAGSVFLLYRNQTNKETRETTTQIAEVDNTEDNEDEIWMGDLGCFNIGEPWNTLLRPVPPPMAPEDNPTVMYYYSWRNKTKPYVITLYPEIHLQGAPFDARQPTAIIIHGYRVNTMYDWIQRLKDSYLNNVKANVFLTDWGPGASGGLLQASSNARVVARVIARFLTYLKRFRALRLEKIHLIGHSLGAHIAAYVAKETPGIPRLTALDPAQLAFEGYDREIRLDKTDAEFVEVIHTDAKPFFPSLGFGMIKPHGHVDFYFNDGSDQPGCTLPDEIPQVHNFHDVLKFPLNYDINIFTCSHSRSQQYLIEAYNKTNGCIFWGHKATAKVKTSFIGLKHKFGLHSNFSIDSDVCTEENCIPFGLDTINSPLRGVFIVTTNSQSPFCIFEPIIRKNESTTSWR